MPSSSTSSLPSEPDVGDRAAVLEDRLDRELVNVGLDVAHVDRGAQLLGLVKAGFWEREGRERDEENGLAVEWISLKKRRNDLSFSCIDG